MRSLLPLLLLTACLEETGPGPDVGSCADYPDGVYTWGEIGIGSCLAGPSALQVIETADGTEWLAVTNANPFLDFASGSLLLIDLDSIDYDSTYNAASELVTSSLELDNFSGGIAYVPERELALVPTRYSPESTTQAWNDLLQIVDLSDPSAPELWSEGGTLTLRDDPQPVVYDPATELAFVVNLTDHSVSVIDTTTTPLSLVDADGEAGSGKLRFFDADASGSRVELYGPEIVTDTDVPDDTWTLTWGDGTYRLWVASGGGLARYSNGGGDSYVPTGTGVEIDPEDDEDIGEVHDPFIGSLDGYLTMFFEDEGQIKVAYNSGYAHEWSFDDEAFLSGSNADLWDAEVSSPTLLTLESNPAMFYDGRTAAGEKAAIGLAFSDDGLDYSREYETPLILPPDGYESIEDPFIRNDGLTGAYRMWTSLFDGEDWSIGLTESLDGLEWDEVTEVLRIDGGSAAAPVVTWANGRYLMWVNTWNGTSWDLSFTSSADGITWDEPELALEDLDATDFSRPARAALQVSVSGAWTIAGEAGGPLSRVVSAGTSFYASDDGFVFRIASGFEIGTEDAGWSGAEGVWPGSLVQIDGVDTLYATGLGSDSLQRILVLQHDGDDWVRVEADLVPEGAGGNLLGVRDPVVFGEDGDWTLIYAALDDEGVARMYRATSTDGLDWTLTEEPLLDDSEDWDAAGRLPHSVETLSTGETRLWYAGYNGSRQRIGSAVTDDGVTFTREPGADVEWQFATGAPGEFDDSSVSSPLVLRDGDTVHLFYAGNDGDIWRIGYATREGDDGDWEIAMDATGDERRPVLFELDDTFAAKGVSFPTGRLDEDGQVELLIGGSDLTAEDGGTWRVGLAGGSPEQPFPIHNFPTAGDSFQFSTYAGDTGEESPIDLVFDLEDGDLDGTGVAAARLDAERGFLYLFSKRTRSIYVLDVRDDSRSGDDYFDDANYLGLEAVVVVSSLTGSVGFRDGLPIPGTDLMYALNARTPHLVVLDLSSIEDDDDVEVVQREVLHTIPLEGRTEDEGSDNYTSVGPVSLELSADASTLFVAHLLDNSVTVFDLERGLYGEEVVYLDNMGENPHGLVRSPDGTKLFVANYLGEVDTETQASSATLAVIDIDPDSPTYLEVLTWIGNR